MASYNYMSYQAQMQAANAAAKAARQRWKQAQGKKRPSPSTTSPPVDAPNGTTTVPPGSPGDAPTTTSSNVPGYGAYMENMAAAERAWREAQAEINRSRTRLASSAGYQFKDGNYTLDPLGAGTFQSTTRQFGDAISQLRDSAAARGMVGGQQEQSVRGQYGDAMRLFARQFTEGEGDIAGNELRTRNEYERLQADALRSLVDNATQARAFDPYKVPEEVQNPPAQAETPASSDSTATPKMRYWGVEFLPWQWDIFVKKAHARGQDPNKILLSHPGLRKFFDR